MEFISRGSPYRIHSVAELPTHIQEILNAQLSDHENPLYMCVTPRERTWLQTMWGISQEYTFFVLTTEQIVLIHDSPKGQEVQPCQIGDLTYFETGMVLLNSWFKAPPSQDTPGGPIAMRYNSVFEREFYAAIMYLRKLTLGIDLSLGGVFSGMPGEGLLRSLPLKFNNVSRRYWLKGEAAITALLVPAIRVPFLRYFQRVYSFSTALILTNWQVLAVVEQGTGSSAGKYGEAWLFCSLGHIVSVTLEDVPAYELRALRLDLCAGPYQDAVHIPYPREQEGDFQRFVSAIYQTKGDVL